jgi:PST family polysaccharide transporter
LALFWSSTIWGVCQGINMLWYFQGLERMRLASALEIGGKVVATLSIFLLVHNPADGWKVLAAQCVGCVVAHGVTVVLAYREVGFAWPTFSSVLHALRLGWTMFLFRAIAGITGSLNGLVLGWVAPMAALGQYAGAERISRVFQQGLWPINQALYPNLTKQMRDNRHDAMKMVRLSIFLLGGLGLLFGLILFLGAPLLVHVVLGDAFHGSIPALRVFSLWIPLIALSTVIIFQLLLPNQMDHQFNVVLLTAGLLGFGCALLLAPRLQAVGIAWSIVVAQLYTLVAFAVVLARARLNPFASSLKTEVVVVSG